VSAVNAALIGVRLGLGMGKLALTVANGAADALVQRRAPYDLVIANILAGPLIELASDIAAIAAAKSQLVLAGLLGAQAHAVARAYRREGYRLAERLDLGDWAILRLRKRT
jgi:ribosomal protein L11 methyltransferase